MKRFKREADGTVILQVDCYGRCMTRVKDTPNNVAALIRRFRREFRLKPEPIRVARLSHLNRLDLVFGGGHKGIV